jgi:GxxExxY protein
MTKTYLKDLIYQVNGCAIEVHKHLGPGLLESVYHTCLKKELTMRGLEFETELTIPVYYKGLELETGLRCDLLAEKSLVVELKAIEKVLPIHEAQILTYMNLLEIPIGLMINFNVTHIFKEGQKTYVNERYRYLDE